MGSTLGLAAIAAAIDHTRHPLPSPVEAQQDTTETTESPCGLGASPCSLGGGSPCALGGGSSDD